MCIVIRVSETQSLATAKAEWTGDQLRLYVHLKRRMVLDVTWEFLRGTCGTGHRAQWLHGVPLTAWVELGQGSVRIIVTSVGFDGSPTPPGGYKPDDTLEITNRAAFLLRRAPVGIWILEQIYGEPLFEPGDTWVPNGRLELILLATHSFGDFVPRDLGHVVREISRLQFATHVKSMVRIGLLAPTKHSSELKKAKKETLGERAKRRARRVDVDEISASTAEESVVSSVNNLRLRKSVACHAHDAIQNHSWLDRGTSGSAGSMADRDAVATVAAPISTVPYGLGVRVPGTLQCTYSQIRSSRVGEILVFGLEQSAVAPTAEIPIRRRGKKCEMRKDFMPHMVGWRIGPPSGAGLCGAGSSWQ